MHARLRVMTMVMLHCASCCGESRCVRGITMLLVHWIEMLVM